MIEPAAQVSEEVNGTIFNSLQRP